VSDKYAFIDAEYATGCAPTIERMCCWLQVSKSGYYEWLHRPPSATAQRRELLKIKIKALFEASDGSYGYRRLHAALVAGGEEASPELVRQLMRELGLVACQPRPWRTTTIRGQEQGTAAWWAGTSPLTPPVRSWSATSPIRPSSRLCAVRSEGPRKHGDS
jgi:putative transposase